MITVCYFLVPAIMTLCGLWLTFAPPKKRNRFFGYRTRSSMVSQESWDFAQSYSGKIMLISGIATLLVTALLVFLIPAMRTDSIALIWAVCIQGLIVIVFIPLTEKELKKFKKEG